MVQILATVCNSVSLSACELAGCYVIFSSTLVLFGLHSL